MSISKEERQRRREAIRRARNSVRLEGVILDEHIEALNQRFIGGEISSAEHTRLGIEHIKAKHTKLILDHVELTKPPQAAA